MTYRGRHRKAADRQAGITFLGVLLALAAVLALLAWLGVPLQGLGSLTSEAGTTVAGIVESSKQARAIRAMESIAFANSRMRMERARYAESIAELREHYRGVSERDPWGHPWDYDVDGLRWSLRSYGSDGLPGPAPPSPWQQGHQAADLVMVTGKLVQGPTR